MDSEVDAYLTFSNRCISASLEDMNMSIYIEKNANHSVDNDFTPKFSKFWNYGVYLTIQYAA